MNFADDLTAHLANLKEAAHAPKFGVTFSACFTQQLPDENHVLEMPWDGSQQIQTVGGHLPRHPQGRKNGGDHRIYIAVIDPVS